MRLGKTLKEKMPIERVVAECGVCGVELYDSLKEKPNRPHITGAIIETQTHSHREKTGHEDLQINIDKPTPVKEIDATINVNS